MIDEGAWRQKKRKNGNTVSKSFFQYEMFFTVVQEFRSCRTRESEYSEHELVKD
jgi:hypothetical protein